MVQNSTGNGGNDIFGGMPWWVKAIAVVGIPSLISVGVVYTNEYRLAINVASNGKAITELQSLTSEHDRKVRESFTILEIQGKENEKLLRMICMGVQKTEEAKQGCWK